MAAYNFKHQASVITLKGISIQVNAYTKENTKKILFAMTYKNVFLSRTMYARKLTCELDVYNLFDNQFDKLQNAIHKIGLSA